MSSFDLNAMTPPWIAFKETKSGLLDLELSLLAENGKVFHLDAAKMDSPAALFEEFAKTMRFPSYFGHNWYALVDCLDDQHSTGCGAAAVTVVLDHADPLVEAEFFRLLVKILCEAAWRANLSLDADGEPRGRPPFPLHFIFSFDRTPVDRIAQLLADKGEFVISSQDDLFLVRDVDEGDY